MYYVYSPSNPFFLRIWDYIGYIDNWFIRRQGNKEDITSFNNFINKNSYNLSFIHEEDKAIQFVDLKIFKEDNKISARTYFKITDIKSCYQKPWIRNISKGQFKRIKWKCSKTKNFIHQSAQKKIVLERHYNWHLVKKSATINNEKK